MRPVRYRRSQTSNVAFFVAIAVLAVVGVVISAFDERSPGVFVLWGALGAITVGIGSLSRLTVTVGGGRVEARFLLGWPVRRIDLRQVVEAERVRNRWYLGWGIRWVPHGWMFNVWGLDAVELRLRSDRVFRIGTDDPDRLLEAIRSELLAVRGHDS